MPRKLHGKRLSEKEHRQWKHVYDDTGSGAQATGAVLNSRKGKKGKKKKR